MSRAYLPVLMLLGFVVMNAILIVAISALTMRSRPTPVKQNPYESGMPPLGDARERFSVKFYLIAILFIIFEPLGLYGRWLKIRTWFELFPFYRRGMFRRQKSYMKSERLR